MVKSKNQVPIIERFNDNNVKIFALGGLGEVGKNMYIVECGNEIVIIDCGIMFPDTGYGVDYVIQDYTYLIQNEDKIKGLFITHGHEDHIGAIPHFINQVKVPAIYANGIAIDLILDKLNAQDKEKVNIIAFDKDTIIQYDNFIVSFFQTNHSIPDSYGIAIKTRLGYIIHTGDFKFDFTPVGNSTEYDKLASYGKEGVLCLLSDSTNALVPNFSASERKVSSSIQSIFSSIKGRIIIATFASNVYRVKQIIEASIINKRKVIFYGRSMEKTIKIAIKKGYIEAPDSTFINSNELQYISDEHLTIITTGSQGEPLAALSRIADRTHNQIKIHDGDTIIFSSSAIPGNQESINRTINKVYKQGANVIINSPLTDTHTSGHASETELLIMLSLTKPKYFVPIHGEYSMQKRHIELATLTGVPYENCFLLNNGNVLCFNEKKVFSLYDVACGDIAVDENDNIIDSRLLKERRQLTEEGLLTIIYTTNKYGDLLQAPNVITRGFIYIKNSDSLMKAFKIKAEELYRAYPTKPFMSLKDQTLRNNYIVEQMTNFVAYKTQRKPLVVPIIMIC